MTEQGMRGPRPFAWLWVVAALVVLVSWGGTDAVSSASVGGNGRELTLKATMAAIVQSTAYVDVRSGEVHGGMVNGVLTSTNATATIMRDNGCRADLVVSSTSPSTFDFWVYGTIGNMTFDGGGKVCISDGPSGQPVVVTHGNFGNGSYGNLSIITIGHMALNPLMMDKIEDKDAVTATNQWGRTKAIVAGVGTIDRNKQGGLNVNYEFISSPCPPTTPGSMIKIMFNGQADAPDPFNPDTGPFAVAITEVIA